MKAWVTITGCECEAMCLPTPRHSGITLRRIKGHGIKVACTSWVITAPLSKSLRQVGFRIQNAVLDPKLETFAATNWGIRI